MQRVGDLVQVLDMDSSIVRDLQDEVDGKHYDITEVLFRDFYVPGVSSILRCTQAAWYTLILCSETVIELLDRCVHQTNALFFSFVKMSVADATCSKRF